MTRRCAYGALLVAGWWTWAWVDLRTPALAVHQTRGEMPELVRFREARDVGSPLEADAARLVVAAVDLAPLDQSDVQFRDLAQDVSHHPLVQQGLAQPGLIETLVGATLDVCEGRDPVHRFSFLALGSPFAVRPARKGPLIARRTYHRYDAIVDAFAGLDSIVAVQVYRELEALFDQAYASLGYAGRDFDQALDCAMTRILQTPRVGQDVVLRPRTGRYEYADRNLEILYPVQRQLLRTGPRNLTRILQKVRELRQVWRTKVVVADASAEAGAASRP